MRILHCFRAPVGGLFRHVLDLAEEQANRGHDVGILAGNTTEDRLTAGKFAALAPKLTLGISRVPMKRMPGLGDFAAVHAVFRRAGDLDLDVVHGHGAKGGAYARLAAYGLSVSDRDIKSFYTPHGGSLNFKPRTLESRLLLSVERSLESMTTGLIFESDYAARTYGSHVGSMGAPQRVIPNGLRTQDFAPVATRDDATDVLFVGELRAIKGVDVLLKAIVELKSSRPITATIVGSGPDGQGLRSFASSLGLDDLVTFTGAMPARQAFTSGEL
jgi:glycosyltransferase involved in cell wall biosynthesis